eukprot:scaffold34595_cov160-Amphora_coffeaeformis.AAC.19
MQQREQSGYTRPYYGTGTLLSRFLSSSQFRPSFKGHQLVFQRRLTSSETCYLGRLWKLCLFACLLLADPNASINHQLVCYWLRSVSNVPPSVFSSA